MGLIRKTFAIGSALGGVPVVRLNSKKQRNAKNLLKAQRETNALLRRIAQKD